MLELGGLFASALLAATLFPAQSEAVLAALVLGAQHDLVMLWSVATLGNVLGSVCNWCLGRYGMVWLRPRLSTAAQIRLMRLTEQYLRWGWVSLFASWVPVIGDPLTCAAGALREPLWRFSVVVTIAKGARYALLIWAVTSVQVLVS